MWVDVALLLLDVSVSGCKHCFGGGGSARGGEGGRGVGMGLRVFGEMQVVVNFGRLMKSVKECERK